MDVLRKGFDGFYGLIKPAVFKLTEKNPELAHRLFVNSLRGLRMFGLSGLVLDNSLNCVKPGCVISNGAGFVKDAEIDPRDMGYLGFDRVVVGSVSADSCEGNNFRPRVWRFPKTGSLVNCIGGAGVGAYEVARRLRGYGEHRVPLTVNLMVTPRKEDNEALFDLGTTVLALRGVPYVERFELNISCPNISGSDGKIDARDEYVGQLNGMLGMVEYHIYDSQKLYLKVSPDLSEAGVDEIVGICGRHRVDGYVVGNTTTEHLPEYIAESPGKGGASGNAVYDLSKRVQRYFAERVGNDVKLIACGGINSVERMKERCAIGNCDEVQIFTGMIFEGTGLLRKLRRG